MTAPEKSSADVSTSALDVLYRRRSVRDYAPEAIDKAIIGTLLDAAVHAPTAMHGEPWSFLVVQDRSLLNRLSDSAKELVRAEAESQSTPQAGHALELLDKPDFHVFHNAGTLIVICSKIQSASATADCWLAAENLMLAACAKGLGTCVIGFSIAALNTQGWKTELEIPFGTVPVAPIIVGVPAGPTPIVTRKPPDILAWK
jgi:nitroreductase